MLLQKTTCYYYRQAKWIIQTTNPTLLVINPRRTYSTGNMTKNREKKKNAPPAGGEAATTNDANEVENHKYAHTLNLPVTDFPMRSNAVEREPQLIKDVQQLYDWQYNNPAQNKGQWVTHDGPPYANGDLHLGHALNKMLKDFVNRYKVMQGYKVSYVPGWDCHGLPIELKAMEKLKAAANNMAPHEIRATARAFALSEVEKQKALFRSWGVMGDWDHAYKTLTPDYEAAQISLFYDMYTKGLIYRGERPVHWSPSTQTALADAELEYNEAHTSRSVYVAFAFNKLAAAAQGKLASFLPNLHAVIWTTTPWTLPANVAVCASPTIQYAVVKSATDPRYFLVAADRVAFFAEKLQVTDLEVVATVSGADLEGSACKHPFVDRESVFVLGDHVTTTTGTGLVHTAPGHGEEDFQVGKKYNLPVLCPVNKYGKFTEEVDEKFRGKNVLTEGNAAVIEVLTSLGALLKEEPVVHKYPYDWRTKKPIIVRTTPQWFVDLTDVQEKAVAAIGEGKPRSSESDSEKEEEPDLQQQEGRVRMIPAAGRNRLTTMLRGRAAWCISRQRVWGVPIPVFYEEGTGEVLVTKESVGYVEQLVREKGTDCWFTLSTEELLAPEYRNNGKKYLTNQYEYREGWASATVGPPS